MTVTEQGPEEGPPELTYTSLYYNGVSWAASGSAQPDVPVVNPLAGSLLLGSEIQLNVNGELKTFIITALTASTSTELSWQAAEKALPPPPTEPPPSEPLPTEPPSSL
jgi:hypothetical protein